MDPPPQKNYIYIYNLLSTSTHGDTEKEKKKPARRAVLGETVVG